MTDTGKASPKKSKQLTSTAEGEEQTEQVDTPTKISKTKLQTINPFLSPRSERAYDRVSTPKSTRASIQTGERAHSSKGNRKSLFNGNSTASSPSIVSYTTFFFNIFAQ